MTTRILLTLAIVLLAPCFATGVELQRRCRIQGSLVESSRNGPAAVWLDGDRLLIRPDEKTIACIDVASGERLWTRTFEVDLLHWSYSRGARRVAFAVGYSGYVVLNAEDGTTLFEDAGDRLGRTMGKAGTAAFSRIALDPVEGKLLAIELDDHKTYGRNGYLFDRNYERLELGFDVDYAPNRVSFSPDGKRLAVITDDMECVHDFASRKDVYLHGRGRTIDHASDQRIVPNDQPTCSVLRHDGADLIVFAIEKVGAGSRIYVRRLSTTITTETESSNRLVVLDVDWKSQRIVFGGTSQNLALIDFRGNELAKLAHTLDAPILSAEFSPSAREVLVTDGNGIATIFEIVD